MVLRELIYEDIMDIAVLLSHTYMTVMPQSNVQKRLLYLV